jgi:ATP-dependent 26S proteasome regulatory subunit
VPVGAGALAAVTGQSEGAGLSEVPRRRLPTFEDVGGMDALKDEMRSSIGLLLEHPDRASEYRITWGGILLHGVPGSGKSFFARALAGEFGCSLVSLRTADLVSSTP